LDELLPHYRIFHQTGSEHYDELLLAAQTLLKDSPLINDYYIMGSIPAETVSLLYDAAAVVITRAGSTTLFEIATHGKPAIVVPIPEDVSRDQRTNAFAYAGTGAASVIEEQNLVSHLLTDEIQSIISDPHRLAAMSAAAQAQAIPDAAEKIATILYRIAKEHE
jgi:UDP-N-acetylglucosamine--N-acetylmuramyl-(pentapeptide) pyrophosphoryl-undecaprenol N-acetylglucosamine transferase